MSVILIVLGVVVILVVIGLVLLNYFSNKVTDSWRAYYTCPRCTHEFQAYGSWYEVCPNCAARLNLSGVTPYRKREEPRKLTMLWNVDTNEIVVKDSKGKVIERTKFLDFKKSKYDNDILDIQMFTSDDVP